MRAQTTATVGFDFGTSTTMIATEHGVVALGKDRARRWMPSLVGYDDTGAVVVGQRAEAADVRSIRSIKRTITMGQGFVRADLPTGIKDVRSDDLMIAVLQEAVRLAEVEGVPIKPDVLRMGCPAMWDGQQRRRMLHIADRAGLPVRLEDLIDEPVAAGIAWLAGAPVNQPSPLRAVVFDMGGGTLDIAVLDVQGVRHRDVAVLAALGIPFAGDTLDDALVEDLEQIIGIDLDALDNPDSARAELQASARQVKVDLTAADETPVNLSHLYFGGREIWYTRQQLEAVFEDQMDRAELSVMAALKAARLARQSPASAYDISRVPLEDLVREIDVVILSGGMTHIPYVRQRLQAMFNRGNTDIVYAHPPASDARLFQQPELAVAVGLAAADHYGRINMYRPAFDILLEWDHRTEFRTVYHAFTPLVEPWQILQGGSDLRYIRNGLDLQLPRTGRGQLRVVSHTGDKTRATLGDRTLDGFKVALSEQQFEFSIYPNGRIRLTDGVGTHLGQLDDWHII